MVKVTQEGYEKVIVKSIKKGKSETLRLLIGDPASPDNLTGWSATLTLRKTIDDATAFDTLTTANGRIVVGAVAPNVVCTWNTAKTLTFVTDYIGDLEIKNPSNEVVHSIRVKFILEKRVAA